MKNKYKYLLGLAAVSLLLPLTGCVWDRAHEHGRGGSGGGYERGYGGEYHNHDQNMRPYDSRGMPEHWEQR